MFKKLFAEPIVEAKFKDLEYDLRSALNDLDSTMIKVRQQLPEETKDEFVKYQREFQKNIDIVIGKIK